MLGIQPGTGDRCSQLKSNTVDGLGLKFRLLTFELTGHFIMSFMPIEYQDVLNLTDADYLHCVGKLWCISTVCYGAFTLCLLGKLHGV